jgi:hypothetical protein
MSTTEWLHVDAAYAGSAAVLPEKRWCLAGCEHADSLVTNPHQWLFVPIDASALFLRQSEVLRRAQRADSGAGQRRWAGLPVTHQAARGVHPSRGDRASYWLAHEVIRLLADLAPGPPEISPLFGVGRRKAPRHAELGPREHGSPARSDPEDPAERPTESTTTMTRAPNANDVLHLSHTCGVRATAGLPNRVKGQPRGGRTWHDLEED